MASHDSVQYQQQDGIAVITLDDGKRNALPPAVLKGIYGAFRQAERDKATVILTGREGVFSAGYRIDGTFDAPEVTVNPFQVLTPGVYRQWFQDIFNN